MADIEGTELSLEVDFDGERLTITVNDEQVRSLTPKHDGVYKFNYENNDYYFHFLEVSEDVYRLFFYPINAFERHVIRIPEEESE